MSVKEFRSVWPNGYKCAVVVSIDFDAESAMLSLDESNARRLGVLSAARYGPQVGVPRLLRLLQEFRIKATFFTPGYDAETHPAVVESILRDGHEIGHHGYLHKRLDALTPAQEEEELANGIAVLRKIIGKPPVGYRAPWWEMNPTTPALLRRHGFVYDSSLMESDTPYIIETSHGPLIEVPVTFLLDDWEQYGYLTIPKEGYCIEDGDKVLRLWRDEFDALAEQGGCYTLTLHPWLSGRASRIVMLRTLIKHIVKSGCAWIGSAKDVAERITMVATGKWS